MKERLQKVLAQAGVASRRAAEELISQGRVSVNDEVITRLGMTVDRESDRILFDGKPLAKPLPPRVIMLNKPLGYLSTNRVSREYGQTVLELIPKDRRYFSIGRLDRDSSGLLLLTDDGDLAFRLTHPRHGTRKAYAVEVSRRLYDEELARLLAGVELEDGLARATSLRRLRGNSIEIVLAEGRNREIRRMIMALGARVRKLHRTRIGVLKLNGLEPGQWRDLTAAEVAALRRQD